MGKYIVFQSHTDLEAQVLVQGPEGVPCSLFLPTHCHLVDESEVAPILAGQTYSWPCRYLKFNKCLVLN